MAPSIFFGRPLVLYLALSGYEARQVYLQAAAVEMLLHYIPFFCLLDLEGAIGISPEELQGRLK